MYCKLKLKVLILDYLDDDALKKLRDSQANLGLKTTTIPIQIPLASIL